MFSISKNKINPIGIINSNDSNNKKYINLNMDNDEIKIIKNKINKINELIPTVDKNKKNKLEQLKNKLENEYIKTNNNIKIENGEIVPYPEINKERDVIYIAGPSGSGKSTMISKYIKNYIKEFPKNNIILFSNIENDPAFLKYKDKIQKIEINADLITDPINIKDELANSLVIMDDIDTINNKQMRDALISLRNEILECGRHYKISMANTGHQLMNYKSTRTLLNESNKVIVFPQSGSNYHIKRFCEIYAGMNPRDIDNVLNNSSRWVCIKKDYPLMIITENQIEKL